MLFGILFYGLFSIISSNVYWLILCYTDEWQPTIWKILLWLTSSGPYSHFLSAATGRLQTGRRKELWLGDAEGKRGMGRDGVWRKSSSFLFSPLAWVWAPIRRTECSKLTRMFLRNPIKLWVQTILFHCLDKKWINYSLWAKSTHPSVFANHFFFIGM